MNIYVGNLSYQVTEEALKELFEEFGPVSSVKIITDKFTGKSKGFAFVEMENTEDGEKAIEGLDGKEFLGRNLKVNKALEKSNRPTRR
jgi:RNA recognition motif-containing protein